MKTISLNPETIIWDGGVDMTLVLDVINRELLPKGTIIKLDRLFFEKFPDKNFIRVCQEKGYPVFVDAKIIDEPTRAISIAMAYLQYRPFMLSIMADSFSTGIWDSKKPTYEQDTLKLFAEACANVNCKSCAVMVLPSKTVSACWNAYGAEPISQMREYATFAISAGITGVTCSAFEAEDLKSDEIFARLEVNVTGVMMPESIESVSDEETCKHLSTPTEAMSIGADRLIIGDDLTRGDIKKNYAKIAQYILDSIVAA